MSGHDGGGKDAKELSHKNARTHFCVAGPGRPSASDGPRTIEITGRENTRAQEHADCLSFIRTVAELEIQIDALPVISALAIMMNASTERQIFSIWNADRMGDSGRRILRRWLRFADCDGAHGTRTSGGGF